MKTLLKNHNCKTELNNFSLRATPARIAVLKLLENSKAPIDTQTIHEYLERKNVETDPATVFRIINMFYRKGIIKQISFNEGKLRYELKNKSDHHHLVCIKCGSIEDVPDCSLKRIEKRIRMEKEFIVKKHSLEFFGLCRNCQN